MKQSDNENPFLKTAVYDNDQLIHFGDLAQEMRLGQDSPCLTDLQGYGLIQISGPDSQSFLQGQLTCDVKRCSSESPLFGGYCNQKGRLYCIFWLFKDLVPDQYHLLLPISVIQEVLSLLKKYGVFSKIDLKVIDKTEFHLIGLWGPKEAPCFKAMSISDWPMGQCRETAFMHYSFKAFRFTDPHQLRMILFVPNSTVQELFEALPSSISLVSPLAWERAEIQQGIPTIHKVSMEKCLPHDINLVALDGVSFKKGCFLGQEIIARMQYLGKLKKCVIRAQVHNPHQSISPMDPIVLNEKTTGSVIRSVSIAPKEYEILAVINRENLQPDQFNQLNLHSAHLKRLNLPYEV